MKAMNRMDISELDEVYELQVRELSCMQEEDISGAMEIARERNAKLQNTFPFELQETQSRELVEKIKRLQDIQSQISGMAKKLRDDLEDELIRVRSESTRFNGYKQASRRTPLTNRFSKHG
jgi:hypothetical protein